MLRPATSEGSSPTGSLAHLDEFLAERARLAGLALEARAWRASSEGLCPPTVDLTAYRIAQEAVTNAVKHAAPTAREAAACAWRRDVLDVVVERRRATPSAATAARAPGHGLLGMRERAELHGGNWSRPPRWPAAGFRVHARLPVA